VPQADWKVGEAGAAAIAAPVAARTAKLLLEINDVDPRRKMCQVSKSDRKKIVRFVKHLELRITRHRPIAEAIVTGGGVLGVAAGWGITTLLGTLPLLGPLLKDTSGTGDVHLQISMAAVLTSTILLETVGLVAGLLPAIKASRLDPIEALRYE